MPPLTKIIEFNTEATDLTINQDMVPHNLCKVNLTLADLHNCGHIHHTPPHTPNSIEWLNPYTHQGLEHPTYTGQNIQCTTEFLSLWYWLMQISTEETTIDKILDILF